MSHHPKIDCRAREPLCPMSFRDLRGPQPGTPKKLTHAVRKRIVRMKCDNVPVAEIAKSLNLSKQTVYSFLKSS
jgi:DNA invertase Pin-like site-specific DNA recombinase